MLLEETKGERNVLECCRLGDWRRLEGHGKLPGGVQRRLRGGNLAKIDIKGPIRPILTRGTNNLKKTPKPRHWYLGRASIDAITTLQTRRSNSIVGARNAPLNMGSCVKFDFKTEKISFFLGCGWSRVINQSIVFPFGYY